jgi:hypothetical protein
MMTYSVNLKLFVFLFSLLAFFLASGAVFPASPDEAEDLSNHPVYCRYNFGMEERVIDVAIQSLAAPLGVIAEVMRRDRILSEQLQGKGMEVRFHSFFKGADSNFFMKRGIVEIAMTGDTPAIILSATYDIVIAALVKQGQTALIAKKQMQISELKGK